MSDAQGRPDLAGFPVNLLVADRPVLVVGGGRIAARKIEPLLDLGARVHVVAPQLGAEVRTWRDEGRLTTAERGFESSDLDEVWLAITATDDPSVNRAVFEAGTTRKVWVNSADDPENCSFTLVSVVRRGDIVVTIGTGGRSPALAAWLKACMETELGTEYETLLDLLAEEREAMRAGGRSSEDADWRAALDSGILELVRAGRIDEARGQLRSCL